MVELLLYVFVPFSAPLGEEGLLAIHLLPLPFSSRWPRRLSPLLAQSSAYVCLQHEGGFAHRWAVRPHDVGPA